MLTPAPVSVSVRLLLLLGFLFGIGPLAAAATAERSLELTPGIDYFGRDYATLKSVSLDDCQNACVNDRRCQAFTYNSKAQWCFLKESYADARPFAGAISGQIVTAPVTDTDRPATPATPTRPPPLAFLPPRELSAAQRLVTTLTTAPLPNAKLATLTAQARSALTANQPAQAATLYAHALRFAPDDRGLWTALAESALTAGITSEHWDERQRHRQQATAAAITAYAHSRNRNDRAATLALLARTLAQREDWRAAIQANRAALALVESPELRQLLDQQVAEHGFRITGHTVESDAASPRICIEFSDPLDLRHPHLTDFVRVGARTDLPIEAESKQLCIDGVRHGERYQVLVRAGLPAADGETLSKGSELEIYVRDRSPLVRFFGRAYVLPKGGEAAIPVVSVNTDLLEAEVHRLGDRVLTRVIESGLLEQTLDSWNRERIAEKTGESVWKGTIAVKSELNRDVTTAIPVGALVAELKPGIYALTARPRNAADEDNTLATQWFIVSDLGLTTLAGNDGLHALVRSLATAKPVGRVAVRLVAVNNEILGQATTDKTGYAHFDPGLLRGSGGNAPALLVAETDAGDYAFLDLTQAPFDLSDRGVTGRPSPKPLDVYLVSERGAYRPGETVHLTALVRDAQARAVTDLPLTFIIKRPDGVEFLRTLTQDQGQGGHAADVSLTKTAPRGTWRAAIHADPSGPALAELAFLVEDFLPERLTFELDAPDAPLDPAASPTLQLQAQFLYGAPASGLALEGEIQLQPTATLAAFPGYHFGLASEELAPFGAALASGRTDASGRAEVALDLPALPPTTKLLEAEIQVRVLEDGGRPVERQLKRPLASQQPRIGLKPLFEGAVAEGSMAQFEALALDASGQRQALSGVRWTLARLKTSFQWYAADGSWNYEPITTTERVADGTLDLTALDAGRIAAAVDWGRYRLTLSSDERSVLPVDVEFEAGWYVQPKTQDTPDLLKLSLDQPSYRVGDKVRVRLEPRFAGLALLMVVDDRLITMKAVTVPEAGTTVELPVTPEWGPGAYVTAVLYRPMDLDAGRMPGRALGLTWAGVDPGARKLSLSLPDTPQLSGPVRPRQTINIPVQVTGVKAGQPVSVTVSAVDLGILNLTRYQPPAPDDWYFAQRRLGLDIRDLYGRLIDRMQGVPGIVRTGGDSMGLNLEGPPPTEALLAYHSGIIQLDAQGRANVAVELPDFNGTVRVMAMAWSTEGVGHAVRDLVVRDPLVVTPTLPRFLAPGDRSRLLLGLNAVEGPGGEIELAVTADGEPVQVAPETAQAQMTLAVGERGQTQVELAATTVGDGQLHVDLLTPAGQTLRKTLRVPVRSNAPRTSRTAFITLAPGAELRLDADRLADRVPGTGSLLVSSGGAGRLDVAGLLQALDRYPYGCAEQLTSRALPLLYFNTVAQTAGLAGDGGVDARVRTAISELLAKQDSSGSFGLWSNDGGGDAWLDAYVSDFLTRARASGYSVPDVPLRLALDNLRNHLSYAADFTSGGEDIAYALYVLARNGRAAIGDLRYYADTKRDAFATPLARAQLAAALALHGDRPRAEELFRNALDMLMQSREDRRWRVDYGSVLRDGAGLLTLAAESDAAAVNLPALAQRLQALWVGESYTSTQEQAWLLLAARALMESSAQPSLSVDGVAHLGLFQRHIDDAQLAAQPLSLVNRDENPVEVVVTTTGVPREPEAAGGQGYWIERAYYDLDGRRVALAEVEQGARLIAVLTITASEQRPARLIVDDPLPAGLEIDNPHLLRSGEIAGIDWLGLQNEAKHSEFRADRFIAALDRTASDPTQFQLAYRVRAVSPGVFAHPAAIVEDMYRPSLRAWTDSGSVVVR
ncbi:hypothetical protein SAMN05421644_1351 [Allochromatium warmingii]|uniref:Apple domain-containing protein n=1 Tax=Allochromatium warmingii TaxID=61595 RepID=A0A1H3HNT0_ALLWA|nr:hypothetical protein SAMN05421644_1351 [Allochromatium warmingii]